MRNVPWTGLGEDITTATNVEEALNKSNLNFNVEKRPIYDKFGKPIKGWVANTVDDTNEVLGIVTPKYQIVQNLEAFDFVNTLVSEGMEFERGGAFHYGKAVWLLAKFPDTEILGDKVESHICFINSHDGKGSVRVAQIPIRIACSNALNMALRRADKIWSTKHMGDMTGKLTEAHRTMAMAESFMEALKTEAEELVMEKMEASDIASLKDTFFKVNSSMSDREIRVLETKRAQFEECLKAPDLDAIKGTKWGVLQAVADFVDHADPARLTANFATNRWQKIATGTTLLDTAYEILTR